MRLTRRPGSGRPADARQGRAVQDPLGLRQGAALRRRRRRDPGRGPRAHARAAVAGWSGPLESGFAVRCGAAAPAWSLNSVDAVQDVRRPERHVVGREAQCATARRRSLTPRNARRNTQAPAVPTYFDSSPGRSGLDADPSATRGQHLLRYSSGWASNDSRHGIEIEPRGHARRQQVARTMRRHLRAGRQEQQARIAAVGLGDHVGTAAGGRRPAARGTVRVGTFWRVRISHSGPGSPGSRRRPSPLLRRRADHAEAQESPERRQVLDRWWLDRLTDADGAVRPDEQRPQGHQAGQAVHGRACSR